jgi:uncharacterized membrane protein
MRIGNIDLHIHSITVHFTNALYPVSTLSMCLFLVLGKHFYYDAHVFLLLLATISVPCSYLTGIIEWKIKYKSAWVRIFISKLKMGVVLFLVVLCFLLFHQQYPHVLEVRGTLNVLYIMLNFATLPLVTYLGYLGGRLMFGSAH